MDAMEEDVAELTRERDEYRELAQRVQADFENYRKRVLREQTEIVERATEGLVEALLPVLDSFELALGTLDDAEDKVRKGFELVYAELLGCSRRRGSSESRPTGSRSTRTSTRRSASRTATETRWSPRRCGPGYRLKGRVLRPAMVKVAR